MSANWFGAESTSDDDRHYAGSRFADVRNAIFANPYQPLWGATGAPSLPRYQVTLRSVLSGIVPLGRPYVFRQATERAVDAASDLRWGADRKGYRRLLHPNGICLTGLWQITTETNYTGYFRNKSRALVVARYSTCCTETRRGHTRSLAMVGKLFPTSDPNHADLLRTANFITQQDIAGDTTDCINDAVLLNAPNISAWRRGAGIPVFLITGALFQFVDKEPGIRQLYQLAELGKTQQEPTRAPEFMRLVVSEGQRRIAGDSLDFRDEVMAQIYDKGDSQEKRTLTFRIEVTDEGSSRGPPFFLRRSFLNWRHIGNITFTQATVSYNGDHVVHFNHPTWRRDRNDPATATRVGGRKVR